MDEIKKSSLKESRDLSLYAGQCVAMQLADGKTPNADALMGDSKLPVAVLANPDGTVVNKLENTGGKLNVRDVEKLVGTEVKSRKDRRRGQPQGRQGQGRRATRKPRSNRCRPCSSTAACSPARRKKPQKN